MATAEQIKSLIYSHMNENSEQFRTVALQVAAHEARCGHIGVAQYIRDILEKTKRQESSNTLLEYPKELDGLVLFVNPHERLNQLVLSTEKEERIKRILHEFIEQDKLRSFGLTNRRKILLVGAPGTGKTMTAKVIAHALHMPLCLIQLDRLTTKYMGETGAKLRKVFELISSKKAVYLFDEFDAIAGDRSLDNDVGEMRRVLNALLVFIEQDSSESMILAATNKPNLVDQALFRRFDDILIYDSPKDKEKKQIILNTLGVFAPKKITWQHVLNNAGNLSPAELVSASRDAIKAAILNGENITTEELMNKFIKERFNSLNSFS